MFDIKEAQRQGINDAVNAEIDKRISNEKLAREAWEVGIEDAYSKLWKKVEALEAQVAQLTKSATDTEKPTSDKKHRSDDDRHAAVNLYLDDMFGEGNGESLIGCTCAGNSDDFFKWLDDNNMSELKGSYKQNTQLRRICTNVTKNRFGLCVDHDRFAVLADEEAADAE